MCVSYLYVYMYICAQDVSLWAHMYRHTESVAQEARHCECTYMSVRNVHLSLPA